MSSMNGGVIGVTAAVNGLGLLAAAVDRSWGAVAVMMLLPVANLLVAIVFSGVGAAWRPTAGFSMGEHLAVSWLVPIGATIFSLMAIASMNLHGC
ncbi:MAG: hypothetical protein JNM69_33265 [Archangium sp.]|nr:hypothetical protein [Archangium sp.]